MRAVPLGPARRQNIAYPAASRSWWTRWWESPRSSAASRRLRPSGQLVDGLLSLLPSPSSPPVRHHFEPWLRGPPRRSANLGERHGLKGPPGRGPAEGIQCRCLPDTQACLVQAAAVGLTSLQSFDADVPGVVLRVSFVDGDIGLLRGSAGGNHQACPRWRLRVVPPRPLDIAAKARSSAKAATPASHVRSRSEVGGKRLSSSRMTISVSERPERLSDRRVAGGQEEGLTGPLLEPRTRAGRGPRSPT